jgi:hypothetical protein
MCLHDNHDESAPPRESGDLLSPEPRSELTAPAAEGDHPMEASHVSALQLKHAGLERQLEQEMSRPMPDLAIVQTLKKRKLRIKEELAHI